MNKYLKLDEEVTIIERNFADEAIAYMEREGIENCDDFLEDFDRFNVADEVFYLLVDECFNIVANYVQIGRYILGYGDAIPYYEKAINVMSNELQIANDFDTLHKYAYSLTDDYTNYSSANYAYAQSIIFDSLVETFNIEKDSDKEILDIYKQVAIPNYEVIKKITINEVEFIDLTKAQEYITQSLIVDAEAIYDDCSYFNIEVALTDKLGVFELVLDVTDAYSDCESWNTSLLQILLRPHDYLGDDLPISGDEQPEKYTIELNDYKKDEIESMDFRVLHSTIYADMDKLLHEVEVRSYELKEILPFAVKTLRYNYKKDIDILRHVIHETSDVCNAIRDEIFRRYNFEIPYDNLDNEYVYLCYTLMILKLFVTSDHRLMYNYTFSNDKGTNDVGYALEFIQSVMNKYKNI